MDEESQLISLNRGVEHFKIPFTLKRKYFEDKRLKPKYFLTDTTGVISSPVLDYNEMNHFILGMGMAIEYIK